MTQARPPLGKWAFANARPDVVPPEEDTAVEANLFKDLQDVFDGYGFLSPWQADMLKGFLESGLYSDVFGPPQESRIFRGMAVTEKWLMAALNLSKSDDLFGEGRSMAGFTFKPKSGSSSWTYSQETARRFASTTSRAVTSTRSFEVLMTAQVSDNKNNLVSCQDGLYQIKAFEEWSSEREVIGLGPVKVHQLDWFVAP